MKKNDHKESCQNNLSAGISIGLVIGAIGGVALSYFYQKNKTISADTVLEKVKSEFLKEGPIEGSWIHFKKEPLKKYAITTKTYTGGISRIEDGKLVQYEFIADAYTGSVLDINRLP